MDIFFCKKAANRESVACLAGLTYVSSCISCHVREAWRSRTKGPKFESCIPLKVCSAKSFSKSACASWATSTFLSVRWRQNWYRGVNRTLNRTTRIDIKILPDVQNFGRNFRRAQNFVRLLNLFPGILDPPLGFPFPSFRRHGSPRAALALTFHSNR